MTMFTPNGPQRFALRKASGSLVFSNNAKSNNASRLGWHSDASLMPVNLEGIRTLDVFQQCEPTIPGVLIASSLWDQRKHRGTGFNEMLLAARHHWDFNQTSHVGRHIDCGLERGIPCWKASSCLQHHPCGTGGTWWLLTALSWVTDRSTLPSLVPESSQVKGSTELLSGLEGCSPAFVVL